MLGLDDFEKRIKNAMQILGADMFITRVWLKKYEKTKKQYTSIASKYILVREEIKELIRNLEAMEQMVIGYAEFSRESKGKFLDYVKEMKRAQSSFNHEFLISKEDKEFHLTYDTILRLAPKYAQSHQDGIILQSEIENLLAISREVMERKVPNLFALSFFYIGRSDKELVEMPYSAKIQKVEQIYEKEFLSEIRDEMITCARKAEEIKREFSTSGDRKSARILEEIAIFLDGEEQGIDATRRVEQILEQACKIAG